MIRTNIFFQFAKKPIRVIGAEKLLFDQTNKCLIFRQQTGEEHLQWGMRGISLFTMLNCVLAAQEIATPLFGGWNTFSYSLCTLVGMSGLVFLKIIAKRTIHEIRLLKSGEFVEIKYFNAFWTPHLQTVHVSEFQGLQDSYFGYHRVELTSLGKAWINLDKNELAEQFEDQNVVMRVLQGIPIYLDNQKMWKKQQQ